MNSISMKKILFWSILIGVFVINTPVNCQEFHSTQIQGIFMISPDVAKNFRNVNLPRDVVIKTAKDTGPGQWKKLHPGNDVSIFLDVYEVEKGDSVSSILENGSIRADENSISIFQILNPEIQDPNQLMRGQPVIAPKVLSKQDTSESQHYVDYALFYDYKTRRSLKETSKDLGKIEHDIDTKLAVYDASGDDINFGTISYQDAYGLKTSIGSYKENLISVARNPKIPSFLRKEINAESRALTGYLSHLNKGQLTEKSASFAYSMLNQSNEKIKMINEGSIKTVKIIVSTRFESGEKAPNLIITYASPYLVDLDGSQMEFPKPTTPTEENMSVADWLIWAKKGKEVMSDRKPISRSQLTAGGQYEIELMVKKP